MPITRTTIQNRAVFEARKRQIEVAELVVNRDAFQTELDRILGNDSGDNLTVEMLQSAETLIGQIAKLNKAIGIKRISKRSKRLS